MGFRMTLAEDGIHALELLPQRDWELIVMDLHMPASATVMCRLWRTRPTSSRTTIAFATKSA
ncbi:hypothetical protein [Paenibacillus cymbidii]|uniref:hypothetical protein n=1 Tax=Paenibacillus cymbidii TaxID=1639034 RepID=UPI0038B39CCC